VISIGALTPIRFVETTRRLRHLQIPTTSATAPWDLFYLQITPRDPRGMDVTAAARERQTRGLD
jgi:hypothetical protein